MSRSPGPSRSFWTWTLSTWVCVSILSGSLAFGFDTTDASWPGLVLFHMAGWAPWIPLTVVAARLTPALSLEAGHRLRSGLVWFAGSLVWILGYSIYFSSLDAWTFDRPAVGVFLDRLGFWIFFDWGFYWIPVAVLYAVEYQSRAAAEQIRAAAMEARAEEAEYQWRVQQLRPHFLFNTLNSLSALVRMGERAEALDAVERLSRILRYTLEADGRTTVPLREELVVVDAYLGLQALRLGDRLQVSIDVDESANGAEIPPMLLQPLIENAIHYGIDPDSQRAQVSVSVKCREGELEVTVENSVAHPHAPSGSGVGLSSIRARLAALYDAPTHLSLMQSQGRAVVRVRLPGTLDAAPTEGRK